MAGVRVLREIPSIQSSALQSAQDSSPKRPYHRHPIEAGAGAAAAAAVETLEQPQHEPEPPKAKEWWQPLDLSSGEKTSSCWIFDIACLVACANDRLVDSQ